MVKISTVFGILVIMALWAGPASAQIAGNIDNDGKDHVGGVIVITEGAITVAEVCGKIWLNYTCVINEQDGSTTTTRCSIDDSLTVLPGDQFDILDQVPCPHQSSFPHLNLELSAHVTFTGQICHETASGTNRTIKVSINAVPAHLAHGDTVGDCAE